MDYEWFLTGSRYRHVPCDISHPTHKRKWSCVFSSLIELILNVKHTCMHITLGTQFVRRGRGKSCTMVKELSYLGACTVWWILNSSFWTHFIFICSLNHEQWCDDCSLLNMYFNKYINYIYGFFKKIHQNFRIHVLWSS